MTSLSPADISDISDTFLSAESRGPGAGSFHGRLDLLESLLLSRPPLKTCSFLGHKVNRPEDDIHVRNTLPPRRKEARPARRRASGLVVGGAKDRGQSFTSEGVSLRGAHHGTPEISPREKAPES